MSQTFTLYRLQTTDSQLDQIARRLQEIENILAGNQALQSAQRKASTAEDAYQEARRALKTAEAHLEDARLKKSYNQQKLYSGKIANPKALQDLQNEASALDKRIATLEDEMLVAMLALEEAETAYQEATAALQRVQDESAQQETALLAEKEQLLAKASRLEGQRSGLRAQLPDDVLSLYDDLRRSKNGRAVASIQDDSCSACGAGLTPSIIQNARQGIALTRCPVCKRILYAG